MKRKTRVLHVDSFTASPHYVVQIYQTESNGYWSTCKVFSYDEQRGKSETESMAIEFAKRLEGEPEKTETLIYQTADESTLPSAN